ncbi:MAG: antitoxin VapB family protein [Promethearchaeota archaeon]
MASKTISITEEIYDRLNALKIKSESFSQLFQRMIDLYQKNLTECFGAWKISSEDYETIWEDITQRSGRKWMRTVNLE